MDKFEKGLRSASHVGLLIGVTTLLTMAILAVANICARGLFNKAVPGTWELCGLLLLMIAVFTMIHAVLYRTNIRINLLVPRLSRRTQNIFEMVNSVISLGIMIVILWATFQWIVGGGFKAKTPALGVPYLPFQIVWLIGLLTICLALLMEVYQAYKALRRR